MKRPTNMAIRGTFAAAFLLLLPSPIWAAGAVGSISATEVSISYQHPGETAEPRFNNKKYRVCVQPPVVPEICEPTDKQQMKFGGLQVGTSYRIRVYCHCKGSGRFAIAVTKKILDVDWHHTAPAAPPPPRIVRLRSAQSNLCLYPRQNRLLYADTCGPLAIMRFSIEQGAQGTQIRHLSSGACIHGGFPRPYPMVVMAPCGKIGTGIWIRDYQNGTYRLDILRTEDQVVGYPPALGPGGCVKPPPDKIEHATKEECRWEPWVLVDMFYLDPA